MKKLYVLYAVVFLMSFAFATHVVLTSSGGSSFSIDEDVSNLFNISINNTDVNATANITSVNITIPSSFTFTGATNATSAGTHIFINTSTVLSWTNNGLVMNETIQYFWFNATAATPGSYNFSVTSTNTTGSYTTNISVTVNDTTAPYSIEFVSPTPANASSLTSGSIPVNVTANDTVGIDAIIVRLYNSSNTQINSSTSSSSPLYVNFTGLTDGTYYVNATVNDSAGNTNSTQTRQFTIDTSSSSSSSSSGGSGGGSSDDGGGRPLYKPTTTELKDGYKQLMYNNWQIEMDVASETHTLTVKDIDAGTSYVTIIVESEPMQATIGVGEVKSFDVNSDGTSDLFVKVDSIQALPGRLPGAHLAVSTSSLGSSDAARSTGNADDTSDDNQASDSGDADGTSNTETMDDTKDAEDSSGFIWWIVVVLVLVILYFWFIKKK